MSHDGEDSDDFLSEVIVKLMELGKPHRPPLPSDCQPAPDCFVGPDDPVAAAAELVQKFDADRLRAYQFFLDDRPNGEVALAPAFTSAAGPMIAVTRPGETKPFGLVGARATLPAGQSPLELLLKDGLTLEHLRDSNGLLLLTMPGADAATFRALGVAACPGHNPSFKSAAELEKFCTTLRTFQLELPVGTPHPPAPVVAPPAAGFVLFRGSDPTPSPAKKKNKGQTAPPPVTLAVLLAGWGPYWSTLQEADLLTNVAWFAAAERLLSLQFDDLAVWLPSTPEQDDLEWLCQHGTAPALRRAVRQSCADSSFEIAQVAHPDFRAPGTAGNFADAFDDYQKMVDGGYGESSVAAARAAVDQQVRQQLVQPLLDLAHATDDPLLSMRYVMAADETRIGRSLASAVHAGLARRTDDPQRGLPPDVAALLREHGRSADRALRIHKSLP